MAGYAIVVVGTSWGGLAAMRSLLGALPADLGLAVVLVQHRHRSSDDALTALLRERSAIPVHDAEDKVALAPGHAYVAPADYHLLVERGHLALSIDPPVRFSRPSIDATFATAADAYGRAAVGVVLTGANRDGAEGLRALVDRGGLAFVQHPATAESPVMPAAALAAVPEARVRALREIAAELAALPVARVSAPR